MEVLSMFRPAASTFLHNRQALTRSAGTALLFAAMLALPQARAATTGSGNVVTETRAVSDFQSISQRGSIDLVVRQAGHEGVQVRADDNIAPLVQTVVDGSGDSRTLRVQFKAGESVRTKTRVVVTVDVVRLAALSSSGSGDLALEGLKTPSLKLSLSGAGDAKLHHLDTQQLSISIAGSGDVQASGRAVGLDVSIAGSGNAQTRELEADDVSVSIAGSGDADVTAHKTISVSIAGSGDVEYGGGATLARRSIAGSGSVRVRRP
jgi:hypothetical protein